MQDPSESKERITYELSQVILETMEEYPEITQALIGSVTLTSQGQVSRILRAEPGAPLTASFIKALQLDPRTRPLAIAVMRYLGGFMLEIREKPGGEVDHEPISHELLNMDLVKGDYIRALETGRTAAANKALDALDKLLWRLRLKTADRNLRKVK